MSDLALVMPYYDNAGMLAFHYGEWTCLPESIKARVEIVIVDDGSPVPAADVPRPDGLPPLRIFRVLEDRPWHQHAARNIGAHEASAPVLVLTDIDHALVLETWLAVLGIQDWTGIACTFRRLDAPNMRPKLHPKTGEPHPHPNSFAMARETFWSVGGYDEDLCGIYGTDGDFRGRLWRAVREVHLDAPLIRYDREVIGDASTRTLPRKEGREPGAKKARLAWKAEHGRAGFVATLTMPYERVV